MSSPASPQDDVRTLSVIIPVFRGEQTIEPLVREILELGHEATSDRSRSRLIEIILVNDCGPDGSDMVLRRLEAEEPEVSVIWLSRNAGQHAATLAGISASRGEWIVTLDEDGQHDPASIRTLLEACLAERCHLAYGVGRPPHRLLRRATSRIAKSLFRVAGGGGDDWLNFSSFRVMYGEIARFVAATAGPWVFLDVALSWSVSRVTAREVPLRTEGRPAISYSWPRLAQHFLRMVASLGARPLAFIVVAGIGSGIGGLALAAFAASQRAAGPIGPPGWTSLIATQLIGFGVVLISLGVVAGFLSVLLIIALGRQPYTAVSDDSIVFR